MKRGGCLRATDGFTIVEVLIVLAVSSILLVSAIALVDGRQGKAEFTTGVNDGLQQFQQLINETASGYYPSSGDFTCAGNYPDSVVLNLAPSGSTSQGTNSGCTFLGKAIQFGTGPNPPESTTEEILPIIGNQYENTGASSTPIPAYTVTESIPRALYPESGAENSNVPSDTVTQDTLEYGLQLASGNSSCGLGTSAICYLPTSGGSYVPTGILAFVAGDSSGNIVTPASGSTTNLQSGEEQMSLYGIKNSAVDESPMAASSAMYNASLVTSPGNFIPASEALICVADVGTNESGLYTISGNLNVTLKIMNDLTC